MPGMHLSELRIWKVRIAMETLESALRLLLEHASPVRETEALPLMEALGRVAAQDIVSPMDVPPFDRSPLDGYCLHSEDIADASRENPVELKVIGEACAGCGERFYVERGQALRVMTGAPVPTQCDCVIRQEDTDEGMDAVHMYASVPTGRNICRAGEDVSKGALMVRAGEKLTAAHIGVLSSLGITQVQVRKRVRAALLCTGDELVQPGQELTFGKIYDANRAVLTLRLQELGVDVTALESEADEPQTVADTLCAAAKEVDILITTGGVSVGKKDIFHKVLPLMGAQRLFWKIAMKPGSPLLCAEYEGKLMICLSGNPFAALACFEVFARPVLLKMVGEVVCELPRVRARLQNAFPKKSPGRRLIRARFDGEGVTLPDNHSSGSLAGAIGCNCLIDIAAGTDVLAAGQEVEIILL